MILFQSYWPEAAVNGGRDTVNDQFVKNLWVMALSCLYCKQLKVPLIMHTNNFGFEYLGKFPYDSILLTLNLIPEDTPRKLFACAKFYALLAMPEGAIHIDNDVFIKSELCLKELEFTDYDIIVELKEFIDSIKNPSYPNSEAYINKILSESTLDYSLLGAYRCGIVGFNNKELKESYCNSYFKTLKEIQDKKIDLHDCSGCVPDLILELSYLFNLSINSKVKVLLPDYFPNYDSYPKYQLKAVLIGYLHLLGGYKWDNFILNRIKLIIWNNDRELYKTVESLILKYLNEQNYTI